MNGTNVFPTVRIWTEQHFYLELGDCVDWCPDMDDLILHGFVYSQDARDLGVGSDLLPLNTPDKLFDQQIFYSVSATPRLFLCSRWREYEKLDSVCVPGSLCDLSPILNESFAKYTDAVVSSVGLS